jgi:hypothetical protein
MSHVYLEESEVETGCESVRVNVKGFESKEKAKIERLDKKDHTIKTGI